MVASPTPDTLPSPGTLFLIQSSQPHGISGGMVSGPQASATKDHALYRSATQCPGDMGLASLGQAGKTRPLSMARRDHILLPGYKWVESPGHTFCPSA